MSTIPTPGAWRRIGHRTICGPGDLLICEVFSGGVGIEQADANEALIAAAPRMLAALQASIRLADANARLWVDGSALRTDECQAVYAECAAAAAEATGSGS